MNEGDGMRHVWAFGFLFGALLCLGLTSCAAPLVVPLASNAMAALQAKGLMAPLQTVLADDADHGAALYRGPAVASALPPAASSPTR